MRLALPSASFSSVMCETSWAKTRLMISPRDFGGSAPQTIRLKHQRHYYRP